MNKNELPRCPWLDVTKQDYVRYHDKEWGVPVHDDKTLFEFIILESAQAGLSWYTILKRRNGYKKAFENFDVLKVSQFNDEKVESLMLNEDIIRHRLKIKAAVSNAKVFIELQKEFGSFSQFLWEHTDNKVVVNTLKCKEDYPATSVLSDVISKKLKQRGFKFFGSTICYAYLQACGVINDHSVSCFRKTEVESLSLSHK